VPADAVHIYLSYPAAAAMGLLHGSDPGHGWPLAVAHASRRGGAPRALAYTTVLAAGHFISTVVVVTAVWALGRAAVGLLDYLRLGAGALLVAVGVYELYRAASTHSHGHHGEEAQLPGLWDMFKYALLLGFAHEEEIALSAIVLLGAHPLLLSAVYGLSVYLAMAAWTLAALAALQRLGALEDRLHRYLHLASPLILVAVGLYVLASALAGG
jgi:ABC-type nickel/cobalt efflux system permease component RcnA